jgi:hypothetical protein
LALELKRRDNQLLIVVGPFNEHMVQAESLAALDHWKRTVANWCASQQLSCQLPEMLPSEYYGDASHPLTAGYAALAKMLEANGLP